MSWLKHYTKAQADLTARLAPETEPAPPPKPSTYGDYLRLLEGGRVAEEVIAAAMVASLERQNLFYRTSDRTIEAYDNHKESLR
jgi:hypothetical protein